MNNKYTLYSVPDPVSILSSLMSTTWAVISWSVPSYIPVGYPIITYEIGYTTHQSNGSCSPSDEFSSMVKTNTSSRNVTINDLIGNSCYLFGVRCYTVNGYGQWIVIGNQTLAELLTTGIFSDYFIGLIRLLSTTIVSIISPQSSLGATVKGRHSMRIYHLVVDDDFAVTSSTTSTITGLGVLVGIMLIVVITCSIFNILLLLYIR